MALGTSQRNIAAALVVANQSFSDPKVVVMVIVVAILGFIILMPLSRALASPAEPCGMVVEPARHELFAPPPGRTALEADRNMPWSRAT